MKVNIKRQTNILQVNEETCSELLDIKRDSGLFVYKFHYSVDVVKALQNNSLIVDIKVSNEPIVPTREVQLFANNSNIISNILTQSSANRDISRSTNARFFASKKSDISSFIPNDKILQLNAMKNGVNKDFYISTKKRFITETVRDLNSRNSSEPVLQYTLSKQNNQVENSQILSEDLLFRQLIDPSIVGSKSDFIVSSYKSYNGLLHGSNNSNNINITKLVQSIVGPAVNPLSQTDLADSDSLSVLTLEKTNFLEIEEIFYFPVGIINHEFYVIFTLLDNTGLEIEHKVIYVNHSKLHRDFVAFMLPPTVNARTSGIPGQTNLEIQQTDNHAQGVYVYKREINRNSSLAESSYTLVRKIPLTARDGKYSYVETVSNFSPIIYRIIPYNEFDIKSGEFTSIVVKSRELPNEIKSLKNKKNIFCSLSSKIENSSITIEINDYPVDAVGLLLYRKDASISQKKPDIIGKYIMLETRNKGIPIVFKDSMVKAERSYEYSVKLFYKNGYNEFSTNKMMIEYLPIVNNIVNTTIGPSKIISNNNDIDITFKIETTIQDTNTDLLRRALEAQGILGFFQNDIAVNRERLQELIAYKIIRTNLTTGDIEDFGTTSKTEFSDKSYRNVVSANPLKSNNEYRYTVYTFLRSAETMIETFEKTVTYTNSNRNFTFKPSKWYHPTTLTRGDIVSANSLTRNIARSGFTLGTLGQVSSIDISLSESRPFLYNGIATKLNSNKVQIQWAVQGQTLKIDHFIVILETLGMKTIVGKNHNISETNSFTFIDSLDNNEQGVLKYHIIPIYTDYSRGTEIKTNRVLI